MIKGFFLISTNIIRVVVFLIVPVFLYYKNKERLPTYLLSLLFVLSITYGLKYGLGIPRPETAAWEVVTPRFPSGHTSMAFTPILFFKFWRYKILLLTYGFIIAYSRLYFNLHVPVDIVASIVIGISIPLLFLRFEDRINQKISSLTENRKV